MTARGGWGLVIGKFLPPHHGHHLLVETAMAQSARTTVIVCAKPTDPIPGERRGEWLREMHPGADVRVIDDRYDENDSRVWAENTIRWLGRAPDAVFSSEDYGERYAALMGARHVSVDRARARVPVSGTAVRRDPWGQWDFLSAPVRGWYALRVCLVGAESTGKTTLARALAAAWQTEWVPEYGREYAEAKLRRGETAWGSEEFTAIAREQTRREEAAARRANRVLVCDTNAFATALWHRRYRGTECEALRPLAADVRCDLYVLTGAEIPFVQDGLRDGEAIRMEMHGWFAAALRANGSRWIDASGSLEERLRSVDAAVRSRLAGSVWRLPELKP